MESAGRRGDRAAKSPRSKWGKQLKKRPTTDLDEEGELRRLTGPSPSASAASPSAAVTNSAPPSIRDLCPSEQRPKARKVLVSRKARVPTPPAPAEEDDGDDEGPVPPEERQDAAISNAEKKAEANANATVEQIQIHIHHHHYHRRN